MGYKKYFHISEDGGIRENTEYERTASSLPSGGYTWLNYYQPDKEGMMELVDKYSVHPLSAEDCLDKNQLPKIERFAENTFIIFNSFHYDKRVLHVDEINFFIGKDFLITICGNNSDERNPLEDVESMILADQGSIKNSPAVLLHRILDCIVDRKFDVFEKIEDEIEESEDKILDADPLFDATELIRLRRRLQTLRKSLFHESEILLKICRNDYSFTTAEMIAHYRDVSDHLGKFFGLTETYRENVTNLMELFESIQNNLMAKSANDTNVSVRKLTIIATVFLPLTLIASIGGMSEWTMMTGAMSWKLSYLILIFAMALIAAINYWIIKKLEGKGRGAK